MSSKDICVVGAGISGLLAIKECLENGFHVTCYEKSSESGGLWRYRPDDPINGSVSKNTVANTSKEMLAISDFPPPETFPMYMPHHQMLSYFEMYAEKHDLVKQIRYQHEVVDISRGENDKWTIVVLDVISQVTSTRQFDGVMVCTGHFSEPFIPEINGLSHFNGRVFHTKHADRELRDGKVEGKNILVVGAGNSAGDVAVDCVQAGAGRVSLFLRNGAWLITRSGPSGTSLDEFLFTRVKNFFMKLLPHSLVNTMAEWYFQTFNSVDHTMYGLKPNYRVTDHQPMINDYLIPKICCGQIEIIRGILREVHHDSVTFESLTQGIVSKKIDVIILATGYNITHPFIKQTFPAPLNCEKGKLNQSCQTEAWTEELFLRVFSPKLGPYIAFIGLLQPNGPFIPSVELQVRWAASIMSGRKQLPNRKVMEDQIRKDQNTGTNMSHKIEAGPWIDYLDKVALQVGVKPNLLKLFFTDHCLWRKCFFGPCYPYQFRLHGPGSWDEARDAIFGAEERIRHPLEQL